MGNKRLIDANALMDDFRRYMAERYDKERCVSEENCKTCERPCLWLGKVIATPTVDAVEVVQEWISVKDRLPEYETEVLTYRKSGVSVEVRWRTYWDYDEFSDCPVTHWMPLPEPPKGE